MPHVCCIALLKITCLLMPVSDYYLVKTFDALMHLLCNVHLHLISACAHLKCLLFFTHFGFYPKHLTFVWWWRQVEVVAACWVGVSVFALFCYCLHERTNVSALCSKQMLLYFPLAGDYKLPLDLNDELVISSLINIYNFVLFTFWMSMRF